VHVSIGTLPDTRFPCQWFQSESGLHQNWMRDYDPTTGRYLEADPLGLVDGASVYGYVKQSPMRFTDPTGQFIPQVVVGCALNPVCRGAAVGVGLFIYRKLLLKAATYCGEWIWEEFWIWYNEGDEGADDPDRPNSGNGPTEGGNDPDDWNDEDSDDPYDWTGHAIDEMMDEDISPDDVYDAIENPVYVRPGDNDTTVFEGTHASAAVDNNSLNSPRPRIVTVWR
jgi:RHS repeat-associated protein